MEVEESGQYEVVRRMLGGQTDGDWKIKQMYFELTFIIYNEKQMQNT